MTLDRPPDQAIVIFGASGDLTRRKLLPALYNLAREGLMPDRYTVIGYGRRDWSDERFVEHARTGIEEFSRSPIEDDAWKPFAASLRYVHGAFDERGAMDHLRQHLADAGRDGTAPMVLYYCATPPAAFPAIIERLGECGVGCDDKIVVEKPFGENLDSARSLNETCHRVFRESRIFRIDHYLGKETVQNILVLRFANAMFERIWNRDVIDHVQITVAESIGVEGRGGYYDRAGAIRDIVQNHILQVLAFLAMEPPRSLDPRSIHDEKVKLLEAVRPFRPHDVVRGQYDRGMVDGVRVPGYLSEDGVPADSATETYAGVRAWIDNWRWAGVPFFFRAGKRLRRRTTEISIVLREAPAYLFDAAPQPNHLSIRIQPAEGASFAFQAKRPGPGFEPSTVEMDFGYDEFFGASARVDAYERLLYDAMCGDSTLYTRSDFVERAWEIVQPALDLGGDLYGYAAGTWGPRAADELIAPRHWRLR